MRAARTVRAVHASRTQLIILKQRSVLYNSPTITKTMGTLCSFSAVGCVYEAIPNLWKNLVLVESGIVLIELISRYRV